MASKVGNQRLFRGVSTTNACLQGHLRADVSHCPRDMQVEIPSYCISTLLSTLVGPCSRKSLDQAMGPGRCSWSKRSIGDSVHQKRKSIAEGGVGHFLHPADSSS